MDYKARHLSPLTWTSDIFATVFAPEPFDKFSDSYLRQIVAPDGSIFLLIHGFYDETRSIVVSYAIEAPPSCLMRRAFEGGDLSWPDFWRHRGWLLRFTHDLSDGPILAEFIDPAQMIPRTLEHLEDLGNASPFELKLKQLELSMEMAHRFGEDPTPSEREYREFMIRHGNKLIRRNKAA